ncbi:hypothetical protein cyc_05158 [Cyclospora cayetanensis]|uniref:Uncharacterized protein n=1 Tax=Cyclospora cayetanensis TaxID=88456 RepID=A0A1D3D2B5_9EIME|nr:hypothetical protein cyc_05158 [Cyclospora cayetanensis]
MVVYSGNALVFNRNVQVDPQQLRRVPQLLQDKQWYMHGKDPAKIGTLKVWPLPSRTRNDVAKLYDHPPYYRACFPGVARLAASLFDLPKKIQSVPRTEKAGAAAWALIGRLPFSLGPDNEALGGALYNSFWVVKLPRIDPGKL